MNWDNVWGSSKYLHSFYVQQNPGPFIEIHFGRKRHYKMYPETRILFWETHFSQSNSKNTNAFQD